MKSNISKNKKFKTPLLISIVSPVIWSIASVCWMFLFWLVAYVNEHSEKASSLFNSPEIEV